MSDVNEMEGKRAAVQKVFKKNSIFFCIGWFMLALGLCLLAPTATTSSALPKALLFLGWGIIGFPKIRLVLKGGLAAAMKPDYEVITTYADGRKESDGGADSMHTNFLASIIFVGVVYVIGGFVQLVHLIILAVKYIVLHLGVSEKPAFAQSGLFILVFDVAVFIGSFIVGGIAQNIMFAAMK